MTVDLDTETTSLSPARGDAIVEVAIVDGDGRALIDTLVSPGRSIPWQASNIHGISDDMVRGAPMLSQLTPRVLEIVAAHRALADALACRSVWNWLDARVGRA